MKSGRKSEVRGQQLQIKSAKDLKVYQKAYDLTMEIFKLSKSCPSEEKYSPTDQIRRASRSVCAISREAWAKRRYKAHFISKITDSASCSENLQLGETARIVKPILGSILHWIADTLARQTICVFQPNADKLDLF